MFSGRICFSLRGRQYHKISCRISALLESHLNIEESEEVNDAFRLLFTTLCKDNVVSHICAKYMMSVEDLRDLVVKMHALGIGWDRGYYVPVAVFTYGDPFLFLMDRRHLLDSENYSTIKDYLYKFF